MHNLQKIQWRSWYQPSFTKYTGSTLAHPMMWLRNPPGAGSPPNTYKTSMCPRTPEMTHRVCASHYTRDIDPKCFMDDRRIHLYTLSTVWQWLQWVLGSGPWAPTPGMQQVLQKERGGWGSCCTGPTPLDRLPTCTFKTLERVVWAADTIQLECLAWAVFDNVMGPGEMPWLSGFETYSQILGCLVDKVYKGLHMHCPACTSALFGVEVTTRLRSGGPDPKKLGKPQRYSMTRDIRKEFVGSYSTFKDKQDCRGRSSAGRSTTSRPKHSWNEVDERRSALL